MSRALLLLPHPDDEFACSMRVRAMVRNGIEVHCAFLTDGGYGGQSITRRRYESLRVLRTLGVTEQQVHWLGQRHAIPDGALHRHLVPAMDALVELTKHVGDIDSLHIPAWEGGHQDHDAAHLLGLALAERNSSMSVGQFPLYTGAGLLGPWFKVLSPLEANGPAVSTYRAKWSERVRAVLLCLSYVSQWRTWAGLLPFFAARMAADGCFREQAVSVSRIQEPPHSGRLLYERRGFLTYREFQAITTPFLHSQGLAGIGDC